MPDAVATDPRPDDGMGHDTDTPRDGFSRAAYIAACWIGMIVLVALREQFEFVGSANDPVIGPG